MHVERLYERQLTWQLLGRLFQIRCLQHCCWCYRRLSVLVAHLHAVDIFGQTFGVHPLLPASLAHNSRTITSPTNPRNLNNSTYPTDHVCVCVCVCRLQPVHCVWSGCKLQRQFYAAIKLTHWRLRRCWVWLLWRLHGCCLTALLRYRHSILSLSRLARVPFTRWFCRWLTACNKHTETW